MAHPQAACNMRLMCAFNGHEHKEVENFVIDTEMACGVVARATDYVSFNHSPFLPLRY
jgi:hypothetical protein